MKKSTLPLLLLLYCAPGISDTCTLKGAEIARYAYKNGFSFISTATGDASCQLSSHKAGGSAASSKNGGSCIFDLFMGKELSPGWSFSDIEYSGKRFTVLNDPLEGDNNLQVKLQLRPKENSTAHFLISGISLNGDDCDEWKSAF